MTIKSWHVPGPPSQALRHFLSQPQRRQESLNKLVQAFADDPTEERFNQLKAEKERLWALEA